MGFLLIHARLLTSYLVRLYAISRHYPGQEHGTDNGTHHNLFVIKKVLLRHSGISNVDLLFGSDFFTIRHKLMLKRHFLFFFDIKNPQSPPELQGTRIHMDPQRIYFSLHSTDTFFIFSPPYRFLFFWLQSQFIIMKRRANAATVPYLDNNLIDAICLCFLP